MQPQSLLSTPVRDQYYDPQDDEYFFDRNRQAFEFVMEYYQNGDLRKPDYFCSRLINEELMYFDLEQISASGGSSDESDDSDDSDEDSDCESSHESVSRLRRLMDRMDDFLNDPGSSSAAKVWMITDVLLIVLSMIHFVLDTSQTNPEKEIAASRLHDQIELFCEIINIVSIGFFTMDLILRFTVAPCKAQFVCMITNWFDLIAIIPFYTDGLMDYLKIDAMKFKIFQLFRIARVARVLKVIKRSRRLLVIGMILFECLNELTMLFIFWSMGVFMSGSLMYFCEHHLPDTAFSSILASCWYSVVTISTLGYGDMVPQSILGKMLAAVIIFASTVFMAVPMTIIVTKFGECYQKMKDQRMKSQPGKVRRVRYWKGESKGNCCNCCRCCNKKSDKSNNSKTV